MVTDWTELVSDGVGEPIVKIYHADTGALLKTIDMSFIINTGECRFGFQLEGTRPVLVNGRKVDRTKGFRFKAYIPLTYMNKAQRGEIIAMRNMAAGIMSGRKDILRLFPHNDEMGLYCDVILSQAMEGYFQKKLVGYTGDLEFESSFLLPMIPHDATRCHWYGVLTNYTHGEEPVHWSAVGGNYTPGLEQIAHWTQSPYTMSQLAPGVENYPLSNPYSF